MGKYGWLFAVPGLILASVLVFIFWQRGQIKQLQPMEKNQGSKMRSELFLAHQPGTATSTATGTNTAAVAAEAPPAWRDNRIPALVLVTQKYSSALARAQALLNTRFELPAAAAAPRVTELEDKIVREITTASGLVVAQMIDKQSGELTSERWQDPQLGEVIRGHHPEQGGTSLTAKSPNLEIELISIPGDQTEYVTVKEANKGYVSISDGGRKTEYWADLGENRFVEYQEGRARQWQLIGENRFQEIDENGQRLSVYRVDPDSREIVLAE